MQKIKAKYFMQLCVIYIRYLIGGTFVFASVIKIKGQRFTTDSGSDHPIDSAWHFFEVLYQSGVYWQFIGAIQLLTGLLLMTQRFAKLGVLMYLGIISNIAFITYSYDFSYTPIITTLMLLTGIALFAWDWDSFKFLFFNRTAYEIRPADQSITAEKEYVWEVTGLILFIFTLVYRLSEPGYNLLFWLLTCMAIGFIGGLIGLLRKRRQYIRQSNELIA